MNPAAAVRGRGPKHVVTKGATPVLSPAEARKLLETVDASALAGLRGSGAPVGDALQLRAGERGVGGCGGRTTSGRGAGDGSGSTRRAGNGTTSRPTTGATVALDAYVEAVELEEPKAALFQTMDPAGRRLTGRALERRVALAMIKRARRGRGASALDVLPHVRGDWDHGVPVERGDPRARAADRGARVAEDDEALRPDGGTR